MTDERARADEVVTTHGEGGNIHLPPPSFVPVNVACALATTFIGFIDQVRNTVGPLVWGIGLVWLIATCVVWLRAARHEFAELPDTLDGGH